jgi:hypothetical protein
LVFAADPRLAFAMVAYAIVALPDEELLDEELLDEVELCPPEEELLDDELLDDEELRPPDEELPDDGPPDDELLDDELLELEELLDELLVDDELPDDKTDCDVAGPEAALSLQPDKESTSMPDIANAMTSAFRLLNVCTEANVRICQRPGDVSPDSDVSAFREAP